MGFIIGTCLDINSNALGDSILKEHTHIFVNCVTFSNIGELTFPLSFKTVLDSGCISGLAAELFEHKKKHRHVKVILTINASGNLNIFNKLISIDTFKYTLIESICTAIRNYGLDGINIDWQHPISGVQPEKFAVFVKGLKLRFQQTQSLHLYDNLSLILTINPRINNIDYYKLDLYDSYVDFFHLKGYDLRDNWMKNVSHYNILYYNIKESINYLHKIGTYQNKIIIGIPFEGHVFYATEGFDKPYSYSKVLPYKDIVQLFDADVSIYDEEYGVSYIYEEGNFVSFEDNISVLNTIEYIKTEGIAGLISSNYKNDDEEYTITNTILKEFDDDKDISNNNILYITSEFANIALLDYHHIV